MTDASSKIVSLAAFREARDARRAAEAAGPAVLPELCGFSLREYDALKYVYQQGEDAGLFSRRRIFNRDGVPYFDLCNRGGPLFRVIRTMPADRPVYTCLTRHGFVMNELFEGTNLEVFADLLVRQLATKIGVAVLPPPNP